MNAVLTPEVVLLAAPRPGASVSKSKRHGCLLDRGLAELNTRDRVQDVQPNLLL